MNKYLLTLFIGCATIISAMEHNEKAEQAPKQPNHIGNVQDVLYLSGESEPRVEKFKKQWIEFLLTHEAHEATMEMYMKMYNDSISDENKE